MYAQFSSCDNSSAVIHLPQSPQKTETSCAGAPAQARIGNSIYTHNIPQIAALVKNGKMRPNDFAKSIGLSLGVSKPAKTIENECKAGKPPGFSGLLAKFASASESPGQFAAGAKSDWATGSRGNPITRQKGLTNTDGLSVSSVFVGVQLKFARWHRVSIAPHPPRARA